jgi:hypothetical protein
MHYNHYLQKKEMAEFFWMWLNKSLIDEGDFLWICSDIKDTRCGS